MKSKGLLIFCLAVLIGLLAYYIGGFASDGQRRGQLELPTPSLTTGATPPMGELPTGIAPLSTRERRDSGDSEENRVKESEAGEEPVTAEKEARTSAKFRLVASLVRPNRSPVLASSVVGTLTAADGEVHEIAELDAKVIVVEDLSLKRFELSLEVPGYRHLPEVLDYSQHSVQGDGANLEVQERITLWPEDWIPVILRTEDGLPFTSITEELGWEPKRLFVNAFDVRVSSELVGEDGPVPTLDPSLASFRPPSGYQVVELPGSVAGSLELRSAPPLWVGLWIHGRFHKGQILRSRTEPIEFIIDAKAMTAGCASLRYRLVDRNSGAPVSEASSTLKADISAHRRDDLSRRSPGPDGTMVFQPVMPGEHELTIERGANIVQRRLVVETGEELDLGEIPIGSGPGLPVRVVDVKGAAVYAWVEIAPFQLGESVKDLYPPNLHRTTEEDGTFVAPVPDQLSILRVRPIRMNGIHRGYAQVGSLNHLVDPAALPPELVIVAEDQVSLRIEPNTPWVANHRVEYLDELGLIVDSAFGGSEQSMRVNLVPGTYTARRLVGSEELGRLPGLVVTPGTQKLPCP